MKSPFKRSHRMVVVPHRPWRSVVYGVALVGFIVLGSALGFWVAGNRLAIWHENIVAQRDQLIEDLVATVERADELESQLANAQMGAEVDRRAAAELQASLLDRQRLISELTEELSFYRNLMNPQQGQNGLDAYRFLVYGLGETNRFRYRLTLQQLGTGQKLISVDAWAEIVGERDGQTETLALSDLSLSATPWEDDVRFRFYLNLEGVFELPVDFEPKQIVLTLKESRKAEKTYHFDWQLVEAPHVG